MGVKLLVYDNIHIEEIRKHAILMTLIKGQGQRSTFPAALSQLLTSRFSEAFENKLGQVRSQGSQIFRLTDVTLTSLKVKILIYQFYKYLYNYER